MTAELVNHIIMTLSQNERERLFEILEPQMKKLNLEDLISDERRKSLEKEDLIKHIIKTQFSKFRNTNNSNLMINTNKKINKKKKPHCN